MHPPLHTAANSQSLHSSLLKTLSDLSVFSTGELFQISINECSLIFPREISSPKFRHGMTTPSLLMDKWAKPTPQFSGILLYSYSSFSFFPKYPTQISFCGVLQDHQIQLLSHRSVLDQTPRQSTPACLRVPHGSDH